MNMDDLKYFLIRDYFWFPSNITWNEVNKYRRLSELEILYPILIAIGLTILRFIFENSIGKLLGMLLGLEENNYKNFKIHPVLEAYYHGYGRNKSESIYMHIAREVDLSVNEVKLWFEMRRNLNKPSTMKKFTESLWRFAFYTSACVYGFNSMYQKSWFVNKQEWWINYPKHEVTSDIYWYYMIEFGFYLSLMFTQFIDVKRKDFWQMFIHHIVTLVLLSLSYLTNFTRPGSFIIILHDSGDIWLELAKIGIYTKNNFFSNINFGIFMLVWLVTRLMYLPFRVIIPAIVETPQYFDWVPLYYVFEGLMFALQLMHIVWFYYICKVAQKIVQTGKFDRDERSESDADSVQEYKQKMN